jgi:hypothetical protein
MNLWRDEVKIGNNILMLLGERYMSKGSGPVVFGLSIVLMVGLTVTAANAESTTANALKDNPANSDGKLIALRPQYGNKRDGNRYTNGGGVKWGNHRSGNRVSGNKYSNGRHKYGNDVSGNKYSNGVHKYGNDRSGNRQWRDHPH